MNIVITGASKGIGFEIVKAFAYEAGNKIIAISRNRKLLMALKSECAMQVGTSNVFIFPFDLELGNIRSELYNQISKQIPSVDLLINNAGLLVNKPMEEITDHDFERVFNVNVKSVFVLIQSLLPLFNRDAHIVNISSMGGFQGSAKFPGLSIYSASKGALAVLSECLAEEFKERKIKVNCLALGAVQTEMLADAFPGYQAPVIARDMAKFISDFAMNGHRFFNGKVIPVSIATPLLLNL
jgi:NAD(P)-dependent dehydrogenase (short-subunit alcohol dehydrogenase family)